MLSIIIAFALFILGLVFVVKGADFLVDGASSLAKRFNIPEIVIGLTIVAFGTSAPELVVNIFSSLSPSPGGNELALGNIIGSNIFNVLLILGIAGVIFPLTVLRNTVWKEIPLSLGAVVLLYVFANFFGGSGGEKYITRIEAGILLVIFGGFLFYVYRLTLKEPAESLEVKLHSPMITGLFIALGFVGLFVGGKLVVDNATAIARIFNVSEKLIGLTIVACGTSLPELATSAVAAFKKRSDIAVGNIVGSNIFNVFLILGISGVIKPIKYVSSFDFDIGILAVATLLLFVTMFTGKKHKLDRWEAVFFIAAYVAYTAFVIIRK